MKRIKITEEQAKVIREAEWKELPKPLKPSNRIDKNFKDAVGDAGISVDLNEGISGEVVQFLKMILDAVHFFLSDTSTGGIDPKWQALGFENAGEVRQFLIDTGLLAIGGYKIGTAIFKKNIRTWANRLFKMSKDKAQEPDMENRFKDDLGEVSNLPPNVSDNDPEFNPPEMERSVEAPSNKMFELLWVNENNPDLAILKDTRGNLYAFYFGSEYDLDDIGGYMEKPMDAPDDEYTFDAEGLENYINDNFHEIGMGRGIHDWEQDAARITKMDDEMKQDILATWDVPQDILNGISEVGASSSGSYVTGMSMGGKKYVDRGMFPSEQLEEMDSIVAGGDSGQIGYATPPNTKPDKKDKDFWTAGNKQNKKMNEDAKTDTQYPKGEFVEMPACSKLDNNKEAQNGGCNQGAGAKIKYKGSSDSVVAKESIYEEVAKKTGRPVNEVFNLIRTGRSKSLNEALKLMHDKEGGLLVVISDKEDPKEASNETYTSKKILKDAGFKWNGSNWTIGVDQFELAKETMKKINKIEYFVDKLEEVEEFVKDTAMDTSAKGRVMANLDLYIKDIANATDEKAADAEIKRFLDFFAGFRQYSFNNTILIWIQKKNATKVASYNQWKKRGRVPKKGTAITILVPIFGKKGSGDKYRDLTGYDEKDEDKQIIGWTGGPVYDISDTKAIGPEGEIPAEPKWWGDNTPDETADELFEYIKQAAINTGIDVTNDVAKGGEKGYSAGGHINITSDVIGAGRVSTMVHEWAHELMHWEGKSKFYIGDEDRRNRALKELQAETVSYVVLRHYGIDASHHATYLALWKANSNKILTYMELIGNVADYIIKEVDKVAAADGNDADNKGSIDEIIREMIANF
jgi:hypothetical protein